MHDYLRVIPLNEKIAKWLGWEIFYEEYDTEKCWPVFIPSGKPRRTHSIDAIPVPDFLRFMDAHIKWTVPKLDRFMLQTQLKESFKDTPEVSGLIEAYVRKGDFIGHGEGATPAMAFSLALEKLIDQEGK